MDISQLSALKGMAASKTGFDTVGRNISSANDENYSAKKVNFATEVSAGEGYGVSISSISRNIDEYLQLEVRNQQSLLARDEAIDRYHKRIQILFGQPTKSGTLDSEINNFFDSVNFVSNNPDFKLQVVQNATALADKISNMADNLYKIRYDADQEILAKVNTTNTRIMDLYNLQQSINSTQASGADYTTLLDNRDKILSDLAEILDITSYSKNSNIAVSASGGIALFDSFPFQLNYEGVASAEIFKQNLEIPAVTVSPVQGNSSSRANPVLISGGIEGAINTKISSGSLAGLLKIRDIDIPEMILQLDNLATTIRDEINKIHNSAGSVPSANILTGTKQITSKDFNRFSGNVRIGMIDNAGKPIKDENDLYINPLHLDLSTLDSGQGPGSVQTQTIIDEINQYFFKDPLLNKAKLGSLEDVRIASKTTNMVANGIFDFDFELVSNAPEISTFSLDAITVLDNTNSVVAGALTGGTVPFEKVVNPGDRIRIGDLQTNFGAGAGGPYTIRATVKVTEADGTVSSSIIDYQIDDTPAGGADINNDRYVATSVNAGSAQIVTSSTPKRYMQAEIVNDKGIPVPEGQSGYLQLKSLSSNYGIIVDNLNSNEEGYTYSSGLKNNATNRGLGHYFQLNNLFKENDTFRNSALNLDVRDDIKQNSNLLSMGKINKSPAYVEQKIVGDKNASATLQFNNNPAINSTITVNGKTFTIVASATGNNEITRGTTLGQTLDNVASVLNSINSYTSGTVDKASYVSNGVNLLSITHNQPGIVGNQFSINYNLLGGAAAKIHDSTFVINRNDYLKGGSDKSDAITINPNSYEIGVGATQAMLGISLVANTTYSFSKTSWISNVNTTISGYAATLTAMDAGVASQAEQNLEKQQSLFQAFYEKFREGSGVDLDYELATTSIYQNSYAAAANILSTANRLFEVLMQAIR